MEFRDYEGDLLILRGDAGKSLGIGIKFMTGRPVEVSLVFDDRAEVARLRDALSRWLETGTVEEKP